MLVDARQLEDGSHTASEVCIVGAGPAGLAIALELAGGPGRVCVVESGGLAADAWADGLGRLGADGDFFPPGNARRRQLGGTANVWDVRVTRDGGGCRFVPLDEIDFEARAGVPYSGWPLSAPDLAPFYARALGRCGVAGASFRLEDCVAPGFAPLPLDGGRVVTTIERFGPADVFTREAHVALEQASNVTVLLHATVATLEMPPGGDAVTRATLACAGGGRHTIGATLFVLAAGGIENPRILLLSGLGNQHDLVGRFFMDHHNVRAGFLVPAERALLERTALYDLRRVRGEPVMAKLRVAEGLRRDEGLLNAAARLEPRRAPLFVRTRRSLEPRSDVPRSILPLALARDVAADAPWLAAAALRRLAPGSARGLYGWSELGAKRWRFDGFHVELQVEHAPDPANRVRLSAERDDLGLPRAAVHWRWTALDLDSLRRTQDILANECRRAGLGRLMLPPADAAPVTTADGGVHHHIGTTRMHADERGGVVDADCRVHGVRNLFVAGSSVFPTGGYANPTLTIVALAIRLAEHLKELMRARP